MNKFKSILSLSLLLAASTSLVFGQGAITTTTLAAALPGAINSASTPTGPVYVNASTNINGQLQPFPSGGIGDPQLGPPETYLMVDREIMLVNSLPVTVGTIYKVPVERGALGTLAVSHLSGATVYVGGGSYFKKVDPSGACVSTSLTVLPYISVDTGTIWTCPATGQVNAGLWTKQIPIDMFTFTDNEFDLDPASCAPLVSDHGGTLGITVTGASSVYAMQVATTSSATTNTMTYTCPIVAPFRTSTGRGVWISKIVADYGVQTTALGTQVNTLASGTYNGSIVFSKIVLPAPGAAETASTVTPVRADAGTLVVTPVIASANTAITTAGGFYTIAFTPSTPFILADLTKYLFTLSLQGTASPSAATVTNLLGVHVYWTSVPL